MEEDDSVTITLAEPGTEPNEIPPESPPRFYLGGSDAAAVLGLSKWKTPFRLWQEKTGQAEQADLSEVEAVQWGNILEPVVADEYSRRTGRKVRRVNRLLVHPRHGWMVAHLDRIVLDGNRILEVKTTRRSQDWEDGVPDYYIPQAQHYLAVTGRAVCDVAVLIGGQDFRVFEIARDESFIEDMIAVENAFWAKVLTGEPPVAMTTDEANARWKTFHPGSVFGTPDDVSAARELRRVKGEMAALVELADTLETQLKNRIGDQGDELVVGSDILATWKEQSRSSLDTKALEAAHPDIAAQFKRTTTFRSFRLK